jgi:VTC domain
MSDDHPSPERASDKTPSDSADGVGSPRLDAAPHAVTPLPEPSHNGSIDAHLSPSLLWPTDNVASYELKFRVAPAQAQDVEAWARQHMALDPHADEALGNAYAIRSIYFDTAELDVFHQRPRYKRRKFRLRRYGTERGVFLERKAKSGDRVAKRRTLICDEELSRLRETTTEEAWPGVWFHRRVLARRLAPRCVISYERVAHVGMSMEGPIRLTLDRNVHCALTEGYDFHATTSSIPLLTHLVILELKFRRAMPALFKGLIQEMGLHPTGVSKYRAGIEAWGLAQSAKEVG